MRPTPVHSSSNNERPDGRKGCQCVDFVMATLQCQAGGGPLPWTRQPRERGVWLDSLVVVQGHCLAQGSQWQSRVRGWCQGMAGGGLRDEGGKEDEGRGDGGGGCWMMRKLGKERMRSATY